MANRSDRKSAFPRRYKRMLALQSSGDVHQDGVVRRLFIGANRHYLDVWPKLPLHKNADLADETTPQVGNVVAHAEAQGL